LSQKKIQGLSVKYWICLCLLTAQISAEVYPIQFSISETKIADEIPKKTRDFAVIIPGRVDTYIYDSEVDYYRGYQESYFAITCKKGGWDCLRHYEILANGCIPYFVDLEKCDAKTLSFLPRDLILQAMHLEGVSYLQIDHSKFDLVKYYEILNQLMAYTREHLTSRRMAEYLLLTANYSGIGNVLYLSKDLTPDYLRCLTLIGLKELLGDKVIDVPKINHIYKTQSEVRQLYGKGISYTQIIDDLPVNRERIEERIRNREFDLVIYGSVHRGLLYHDLVTEIYEPEKIVYLCGEDFHSCEFPLYLQNSPLFLREFEGR